MNSAAFASVREQLIQLDIIDLRAVLDSVFHHSGNQGDRTITYFNQSGPALSAVYLATGGKKDRDPRGEVNKLRPEAALSNDDIRCLREQLVLVTSTSDDLLASFFHFSFLPVTGWWRYRDQFQLLLPPPGAPLPSMMVADHPFLVEACYAAPDHRLARSSRQMRTMNELRLLLPALLRGPIYKPHAGRPVKHWVLPTPTGLHSPIRTRERMSNPSGLPARRRSRRRPVDIQPFLAQEYYEVAGRPIGVSKLSGVEDVSPMGIVDDHHAYYRATGVRMDDVVEVPAVLTQLFDNFYALNEGVARQYLRACYWLNMGRFFHDYSASASFFADVAALEVMLLGGEAPHPCPECGFPHHPSISKEFRAFIATYVPDKPDRETFYDMRSKIVHGSSLLQYDMRDELGGFYPGQLEQYEQRSSLRQVSKVALVNWLLAQSG